MSRAVKGDGGGKGSLPPPQSKEPKVKPFVKSEEAEMDTRNGGGSLPPGQELASKYKEEASSSEEELLSG